VRGIGVWLGSVKDLNAQSRAFINGWNDRRRLSSESR